MNDLLKKIFESGSGLYIELLIEEALPNATGADKELLETMANTRGLDNIHLLAADALGLHKEAAEIRAFLAKKASRPKAEPELLLCD